MTAERGQRNVLITGGAGFVGSHLTRKLLGEGDRVTVLDNLSTGRATNLVGIDDHPNFDFHLGDVVNYPGFDDLVSNSDLIVHLAAVVGVQLVIEDPLGTLHTNIAGTETVLESAARHGVTLMMASTSEVYGKSATLPFAEDGDIVLGPTSRSRWGYAASKMVDEFLALAYHEQRGVPVVVFRLFNTVGPGQTGRYGMVVPRFVDAALRGDDLVVHDDGGQRRCLMHVADAIDAIDALSRCQAAIGKVFNLGSCESVSILELANMVIDKVSGVDERRSSISFLPYAEVYGPGFEDMRAREPDTTKARAFTGWTATRSLDAILDDVIADKRDALAVS